MHKCYSRARTRYNARTPRTDGRKFVRRIRADEGANGFPLSRRFAADVFVGAKEERAYTTTGERASCRVPFSSVASGVITYPGGGARRAFNLHDNASVRSSGCVSFSSPRLPADDTRRSRKSTFFSRRRRLYAPARSFREEKSRRGFSPFREAAKPRNKVSDLSIGETIVR